MKHNVEQLMYSILKSIELSGLDGTYVRYFAKVATLYTVDCRESAVEGGDEDKTG